MHQFISRILIGACKISYIVMGDIPRMVSEIPNGKYATSVFKK